MSYTNKIDATQIMRSNFHPFEKQFNKINSDNGIISSLEEIGLNNDENKYTNILKWFVSSKKTNNTINSNSIIKGPK